MSRLIWLDHLAVSACFVSLLAHVFLSHAHAWFDCLLVFGCVGFLAVWDTVTVMLRVGGLLTLVCVEAYVQNVVF